MEASGGAVTGTSPGSADGPRFGLFLSQANKRWRQVLDELTMAEGGPRLEPDLELECGLDRSTPPRHP